MVSRQAGHFFFEPKGYDDVNQATHEHKEEIKVGYNLRRKVVLMALWALSPAAAVARSHAVRPVSAARRPGLRASGRRGLAGLGVGGLLFRTVHLFFIADVQTGLVWMTKILTDPFHDIKLYHRAPLHLLRGELIDGGARDAVGGGRARPEAASLAGTSRRLMALLVSSGVMPPPAISRIALRRGHEALGTASKSASL